jgi:acyl phosphate:glycerol-3-phosphate acyltransferase
LDRHHNSLLPDRFIPKRVLGGKESRHRYPATRQREHWRDQRSAGDGKKWGYLVLLCDSLKGFLAVKVGVWLGASAAADITLAGVLAGILCIIGHNYTVWLRFKGGKGIATSIGVLLAIVPVVIVLIILIVWLAIFFIWKYVSLASICAALSLPVAVLALFPLVAHGNYWVLLIFSLIVAALAVWRHRSNIDRLLHGKENRFGSKR